ncbi:MAG TPA: HRDC domain-containing protein [Thermoanaerobaculia bacterium]|nr:HRDC domain-containing protein [Thermoanaerobaculia bacterium]
MPPPLSQSADVTALAAELAAAGGFALDLEFVSESRYVPELALVQVAWGDAANPEVAAVDPLAVDPWPIVELVGDPAVTKLLHAGHGDLALLGHLYGARGANVLDTQIGAAFLGLGEQVGYAPLVERLLGVKLDKTSQFTQWARRPLTPEQLAYALDDVRYLPRLWQELSRRLAGRGRLGWVEEETRRMAEAASRRLPPEETYRRLKGWSNLNPRQLGALRALAAWREREALAGNKPPSWILQEGPLLALARRPPKSEAALEEVRGVSEGTAHRHGRDILAAVRQGWQEPVEAEREPFLSPVAQSWAAMLSALIQARSREGDVAARFVASRGDAETLAGWWSLGNRDHEPDLPLLQGWRRELAGQAALDWLAGRAALVADEEAPAGLRVAPRGQPD